MRILVLGGAGYIGSHTVYEQDDESYEVNVVEKMKVGLDESGIR